MNFPKKPGVPRAPEVIGWREIVSLPDLGIDEIKAKIDTGARTSALHAVDPSSFERDGKPWVRFMVPTAGGSAKRWIEAPVLDQRAIKNTGGVAEQRLIIRTSLLIGRHHWHIEVSLADRENMEFDLILGRTAIRRRGMVVDPGRSFALGPPKRFDVKTPRPTRSATKSFLEREIR